MKKSAEEPRERLRKLPLSKRLGLSRPTIDKYLAMDGAPSMDAARTYDVEEAAKWIEKNTSSETAPNSLNEWRCEKIKLDCQRVREQLARDRGEYISKAEASRVLTPLMKELSDLVNDKFVRELPSRFKGRDTVEIMEICQVAADDIADRFKAGTRGFTQ